MRRRAREMDGREGHESADTGGADRGVTRRRVLELGVGALAAAASVLAPILPVDSAV